ncbi:MAG TPA: DUF4136 domain-containing protein [Steroidobacteraceae bacterium]|nr:DUF4136 domain-containing protein [Steroidobacteraceae bacterium]
MKLRHAAVLSAFTLLVACASAPKIHTNADPAANLSAYHTYTFAANPGTNRAGYSTPITGYFKEAIRREMDARGYKFVEAGDAELLVNFSANAHEQVDVRSTPGPTYGYGGGYYGYRGGLYGAGPAFMVAGAPEVETVRYKVGTANVDVVDSARKQMVWEGVAEGTLTDKMMADPRTAVSTVIASMFAKYPGRAAP